MCQKKLLSLTIFVTALVFFGASPRATVAATGDLWLNGWARRQLVTIDFTKVSGDLVNFPVLVTEANIKPSLFSHAKSDGFDIVVTAADGNTVLSRELVSYDATAHSMELWVRIPALSSTVDTQIYLYYDNPAAAVANDAATWDDHYLMVQHMNDYVTGPGTILDSTAHQFVGTKGDVPGPSHSYDTVYPSIEEPGKIGKAQGFHRPLLDLAGGGWINVGVHPEFNLRQTFTVEVWANPDCLLTPCSETQYAGAILSHDMLATGRQWDAPILMDRDIMTLQVRKNNGDNRRHAVAPNYSQWNHVATTYDYLGEMAVWLNGNEYVQPSVGELDDAPNTPLVIGTHYLLTWHTNPGFIGSIDEARVSNVVRSEEWILTGRDNQTDPSSFYSVSAEEAAVRYVFSGFFAPIHNNGVLNQAKAGQSIPIKWRLTDTKGSPITDPAIFKSVTSIGCTAPISTEVIEGYAGSSGLRYLGNGYWQFNWKTSKSYAGQCRIMHLNLADQVGVTSTRTAKFKFK